MKTVIGLLGKKQSGKDTVASILVEDHGFTRVAFADPLKEALLHLDPYILHGVRLSSVVDMYGWEDAKTYHEVRRLLQELGLAVRMFTYEDAWLDRAVRTINLTEGNVVVTDVRFPNEAEAILDRGGYLWRVERPGTDTGDAHISETALDHWPTMKTFVNDGTVEDLRQKVKEALSWPSV